MKRRVKPRLKWKKQFDDDGHVSFWAFHDTMLFAVYYWSKNGKIRVELSGWANEDDEPTYEETLMIDDTLEHFLTTIKVYQNLVLTETAKALKLRSQLIRSFVT